MFAHVRNPKDGGSHSCIPVGNLGQFFLGRPEALVVFLRILLSLKTLVIIENLRFDRFVQSLILE
jgi:hypothetical protein